MKMRTTRGDVLWKRRDECMYFGKIFFPDNHNTYTRSNELLVYLKHAPTCTANFTSVRPPVGTADSYSILIEEYI